jgi:hypothetical protein
VREWLCPDRLDKAISATVSSGYQIAASIIWVHIADQSLSRVRKVADAFALSVSLDTALVLPPVRPVEEAEELSLISPELKRRAARSLVTARAASSL